MFNAINFNIDYESGPNLTITGMKIALFLCPSEGRQEVTIGPFTLRFGS